FYKVHYAQRERIAFDNVSTTGSQGKVKKTQTTQLFSVALQDMCPLRFILIFFSAVLAAYFAWTTVRSSPEIDFTAQDHNNKSSSNKEQFNFIKMIQNGFWVFVDMASGKYLWRNLRSRNEGVQRSANRAPWGSGAYLASLYSLPKNIDVEPVEL
ncbi:hypothetical protein CR513_41581, partial [Mucuna pruriens]